MVGIFSLVYCAACTPTVTRNPVFVSPADYLNQEVQVCGYVDGPNILESRDRRKWSRTGGVSIVARGPLDQRFEGRVCVVGLLEYIGCATETCTGAAFDYAIRIIRVLDKKQT